MGEVPGWATGVDVDRPSAARKYDYALGSSHTFEADRQAQRGAAKAFPDVMLSARANRLFLSRAVRFPVTELGVTQFLDLGVEPGLVLVPPWRPEMDPADRDPLAAEPARSAGFVAVGRR